MKDLLVFQHVPQEPLGLIEKMARQNGMGLQIVELWKPGYKIPDWRNFRGLVGMGGPMGVGDSKEVYPSKDDELRVYRGAILEDFPMLGLCLSAQLMAHALGAKVHPNIVDGKRIKEIGYYDLELKESDPIFKGFKSPLKVLEWHGDVFELPEGAKLLASSELAPNQAFRKGNVIGTLFHFEMTPEMIDHMIRVDNAWIHDGFELDDDKFRADSLVYEALMESQCKRLMDNFTKVIKAAGR